MKKCPETIDPYDQSGNLLAPIQEVLTGARMDVDSPATSMF
jgi:hypothetical protein